MLLLLNEGTQLCIKPFSVIVNLYRVEHWGKHIKVIKIAFKRNALEIRHQHKLKSLT